MRFIPQSLASANLQPEDDIDKLFTSLPQIEPPDELIARILTHVQHLTEPSAYSPPTQSFRLDPQMDREDQALVIHNEQHEPS
jgi:hypothetical protein